MINKIFDFTRKNFLLNPKLKKFIYINGRYWVRAHQKTKNDKYILVDLLVDHPGYIVGNCVAANYLKKYYNTELIGIVRNRLFYKTRKIAESYGIKKFIYPESFYYRYRHSGESRKLSHTINLESRKSLLNLHFDGVKVGDLIYDTFLKKTGYGTILKLSDLRAFVTEAVYFYRIFSRIFSSFRIVATVQGHIVYNVFGILARIAVKNGATVYARKPASGPMTIKRCSSMEDLFTYELRVDPFEFEPLFKTFLDLGIQEGQRFMQNRFFISNDRSDSDAVTAFSKTKKFYNKKQLLSFLGIKNNNPIVCIMSHIFPDAPHSHRQMLYDDYFLWLIETLKIIRKVQGVNWLIKEHPSVQYYNPVHTATKALKEICPQFDNIKMVPPDLNSASLVDIVDAIVTVRGTAGLEFSTFGIPCILAGESPYSGYGFTIEPYTRKEYAHLLQNIKEIGRLTDNQIDQARFIAFLIFCLFKAECSLMPEIQAVFWKNFDENAIWNDALNRLKIYSPELDPLYRSLDSQWKFKQKRTYNPANKYYG